MTAGNGRAGITVTTAIADMARIVHARGIGGVESTDRRRERGDHTGTGHQEENAPTEIGHLRGHDRLNHAGIETDATVGIDFNIWQYSGYYRLRYISAILFYIGREFRKGRRFLNNLRQRSSTYDSQMKRLLSIPHSISGI